MFLGSFTFAPYMHRAFSTHIQADLIRLDDEEGGHVSRVLRLGPGDSLEVTDGKGNLYDCIIEAANKKEVIARITKTRFFPEPRPRHTLAIAPTKNIDRMEWLAEKAVEMGIARLVPLLCKHSERKQFRADRMEKIMLAAMKQSQRVWLPELAPMTAFSDFVRENTPGVKAIAHCRAGEKVLFQSWLQARTDSTVLIGPEGDFSVEEIALAENNGFSPITLGDARLRTETAGLLVCAGFFLLNKQNY